MSPSRKQDLQPASCEITVLATSDLHLNLCPWDHYSDRAAPGTGLASVAGQIARLRAAAPNALLVDNGDFLQGTALGDALAEAQPTRPDHPHPMIEALSLLRYDAVTLGNHDFDYGLDFLDRALADAGYPVLCANLDLTDGTPARFRGWAILDRLVTDGQGRVWPVRIGLAGFLPPQVTLWNSPHLHGRARATGIVEAARAVVPQMIAAGAEVIIALCHSGIGTAEGGLDPGAEDAALALAALPGIDAVIAGHTHQLFPGPDVAPQPGVDPVAGRLAGKPACMPGYAGSHLGVLRLTLDRMAGGGWRCSGGTGDVIALGGDSTAPMSAPFVAICQRATAETRRHLDRPAGQTEVALTTHFAMAGDCQATRLAARAMQWHVAARLASGPHAGLPVLAATAPTRAGGRGGPGHYTDLPAGPLRERDLAALCPYPNAIRALRVTGADLAAWLNHSARAFRQIAPGAQEARLLDPGWPTYNFDVIEGLSYEIDLSAAPGRNRILALCHDGIPVDPGAEFILATTSYRAAGGGGFPATGPEARIALSSQTTIRSLIGDWLAATGTYRPGGPPIWRFAPQPGTSVVLETGPGALAHLPRAGMTPLDIGPDGFLRLRLAL